MREYAEKHRLSVIHEFQLTKSSTKFKECTALVVDAVDRLQRSFKESVILWDLLKQGKLTLHFLRERLVLDKNSNSSDLTHWNMDVFMARASVLQLEDNVKRSLEQARKNGIRTGFAPLGYLNVKDKNEKKGCYS